MFSHLAKRTMCCLMAMLLLTAAIPFYAVSAETDTQASSDVSVVEGSTYVPGDGPEYAGIMEYTDLLKVMTEEEYGYCFTRPQMESASYVDRVIAHDGEIVEDETYGQAVQLLENGGTVTFELDIPTDGLYNMKIFYKQAGDANVSAALVDIMVDGGIQSYSMDDVKLPRYWTIGEVVTDKRGNELSHEMEQVATWREHTVYDAAGRHNDPLLFAMFAGTGTVTLRLDKAGVQIAGIMIYQEQEAPAYKAPADKAANKGYLKVLEGERYSWVSDSSIQVTADSNNPAMSHPAAPNGNDPVKRLYNAVGGTTFATTQQAIGWDVEVPADGYYKLTFKVRQTVKTGSFSTRALRIDGKIPFAECAEIRFPYSTGWYNETISTEKGEEMLFYLTKGKHTISLEAVPGKLSDAMVELQSCVDELNRIMRQVNGVVGSSSDQFRDYNLDEEIPTLPGDVAALLKRLVAQRDQIVKLSGDGGSQTANLQTMITQLELFTKDIDQMALKLDSFKNNITALASWVNELLTQPLEMDYVAIYSPDKQPPATSKGFFEEAWFTIERLAATFAADYGQIGDIDPNKPYLKVWISTGQEQMQIVQSLANEYSSLPETKVGVKVELVSANLLEAVMAGKGPDISLQQANDVPVNLAARGELVDLTQFKDFDGIRDRYHSNSFVPYTYKGGVYGIPLTEGFSVMYVRTDIFEEMGLEVPQTWEELYELATILQRSNLDVGIPADMSIYATMLYQNGGHFFNQADGTTGNITATNFGSQESVDAFKAWTSLYTERGFDLAYDLFNRFRSGEMPIGLGSYSLYNQLKVSAPEINGRWQMYPVVGTPRVDENGNEYIDRSWSSAAQGSVGINQGSTCTFILKGCKDRGMAEEAWKFLKWYTSDEVRVDFALRIEMRMGIASRYTPANYKAMDKLPWSDAERELLLEQWDKMVLFPEVPGSYYVGRNLTYAFRKVVYDDENPVYALNKYNDIINRELARKLGSI